MTRCTATTKRGTQCKNSAVLGTNPPRCSIPSHQTCLGLGRQALTASTLRQADPNTRTRKPAGAPKGNKNAEKHGVYSRSTATLENIADAIADLQQKRQRLSKYIDDNQNDLEPLEYAKLLDLLGRLDSRIARLYKQLRELTGEGTNEMEDDFDIALEIVSRVLNIDLTGA